MEKFSLTALARQQLNLAQNASSGRSAHTVYGGHEHVLRQTLIALAAGRMLDEHENPGEATVHVLHAPTTVLPVRGVTWHAECPEVIVADFDLFPERPQVRTHR